METLETEAINNTIEATESIIYWIARSNDNSVVHIGETSPGQVTSSGQEIMEQFTSKDEWSARALELGIEITEY